MIEINLQKLDRGTHEGVVTVHRAGKVFQRKQKLGTKDKKQVPDKTESFKDVKTYRYFQDFLKNSANELKAHGIKGKDLKDFYNNIRVEKFKCENLSKEDAISAITDNIDDNVHTAWFRRADKGIKQRLFNYIVNNDKTRSAGLKVMYDTYVVQNDSKISFNEFLNKDITFYRAGGTTDIFSSFTMDKNIAKKFAKEYGTDVSEIKLKPIQTLGSYQTIAEAEVLIPKKLLKDIK